MKQDERRVSDHYGIGGLADRILAALEATGKDLDALAVDDLAPIDAFHIRGRKATEELAQWTALRGDDLVLDVGCGLGGTGRHLAAMTGCRVVGVDLTDEYCRVARMLSSRVGLGALTEYRQGSAVALPFEARRFDVVWTEHVQMNIADKTAFYGEIARVLKEGGQFAFHDVFAGSGGDLRFPVPWAADRSISHLADAAEIRALLLSLGLVELRWEDKTAESADFFRTVLERVRSSGWMPLGLHLLMGPDAGTKFSNLLHNLEENRVRVVQAVLRLPAASE